MPPEQANTENLLLAQICFAAGCALLAAILLRRSYRYFGKSRKRRGASGPHLLKQHRPTDAWEGSKHDAEARFDRQSVQLHELARELNGQIDSKMVLLRKLIAQSDRQIARLETLLEQPQVKENATAARHQDASPE